MVFIRRIFLLVLVFYIFFHSNKAFIINNITLMCNDIFLVLMYHVLYDTFNIWK